MNTSAVDPVVQDRLYRGHILYPYRAVFRDYGKTAPELGCVYPARPGPGRSSEPSLVQTECLLVRRGERPSFEVETRFLHLQRRDVGILETTPYNREVGGDPRFRVVPELAVAGKVYETWQEAVERRVKAGPMRLISERRSSISCRFSFAPCRSLEPLRDGDSPVGVLVRHQQALEGKLEIEARPLSANCFKITVRVSNLTPLSESCTEPEALSMRSLVATHTLLQSHDAEFVSMVQPPDNLRTLAESCTNIGSWPVLVGDRLDPIKNIMLAAPVCLQDYPESACRRQGRSGDGVNRLTFADTRARLQEGSELENGLRFSRSVTSAVDRGIAFRPGDKVRIRLRTRSDTWELMIGGRAGRIQSLEQDRNGLVNAVIALEDDLDWHSGLARPAARHRLRCRLDEIEPLSERAFGLSQLS